LADSGRNTLALARRHTGDAIGAAKRHALDDAIAQDAVSFSDVVEREIAPARQCPEPGKERRSMPLK